MHCFNYTMVIIIFLFFITTINSTKEVETKSSQYKGVCWHKASRKWCVCVHVGFEKNVNGKVKQKRIGGKSWDLELDAAKQVNKICDLYGLKHKNPGIGSEPEQNKKSYNYVRWSEDKKQWTPQVPVGLYTKDKHGKQRVKRIGGRYWDSELDAAKQVNKICEHYGLEHKNPGIGAEPMQFEKRDRSQYKYVFWHKVAKKWLACVYVGFVKNVNGKVKRKQISGKLWDSKIDAARQVNKICEDYGLEHKNPGIGSKPEHNKNTNSTSVDSLHGEISNESLQESSKDVNIKNKQEPYYSIKRKREDTERNAQRNLENENRKINYHDFYFKSDYLLEIQNSFN